MFFHFPIMGIIEWITRKLKSYVSPIGLTGAVIGAGVGYGGALFGKLVYYNIFEKFPEFFQTLDPSVLLKLPPLEPYLLEAAKVAIVTAFVGDICMAEGSLYLYNLGRKIKNFIWRR